MEPLTTSVKMLVVQSCLTLGDPIDSNPLGCSVHGILQARILEAIPFSRHLPNPGIERGSLALQADSLPAELPGKPQSCIGNFFSFTTKNQFFYHLWSFKIIFEKKR